MTSATPLPPLQLPRMSASEAKARATIAQVGLRLTLSQGPGSGPAPLLSLQLVPSESSPSKLHPWTTTETIERLAFEWAGGRFFIDIPSSAMHDWIAGSLGGVTLAQIPTEWSNAALETGIRWLTDSFSDFGKGHARLVDHTQTPSSLPGGAPHLLSFEIQFESSKNAVHGLVHADSLGVILLASLLESRSKVHAASPGNDIDWGHLPVSLCLTLGEADITTRQCLELEAGDVVFMTQRFIDGQQRLMLRSAPHRGQCWAVSAQLNEDHLILTGAPSTMSNSPDTTSTESDESRPVSVDAVPVRLSFDVGQKTVTWSEMASLAAGDTLALDRPTTEYVTIRANGAVIGKGHLVEMDNRLGVALDQIHAPTLATQTEGHS